MPSTKQQPLSADDELKARWDAITDPLEMLEAIVEHSGFLGGDPYYKDLAESLLGNADRVVAFNAREPRDKLGGS